MPVSLAPVLLAIEVGFLFSVTWRASRLEALPDRLGAVWPYLSWVTAYAMATTVLGARGVYVSRDLLVLMPGLWLQLVTVIVCVAPPILFESVRNGLRRIVDATPWHWLAYFQALRIAALGTAYKTHIGAFPVYFELLVGVPDLLYGLSALWVARRAQRGDIDRRGFLIWNLAGALVIVPATPILLQLGLPGPLQVFTSLPDARAVFTYPMSIAPMIGVPLLVLTNLLVAWRLWEHGQTGRRAIVRAS